MTISFAQKRNWKRIDAQKVAGLASMVFVGRSANGMLCVVVSITARPVSSYFSFICSLFLKDGDGR